MALNGMAVLTRRGEKYSLDAVDLTFDYTNRGIFSNIRDALAAYAKEMSRGVSLSLGNEIPEADRSVYNGFKSNLQTAY